MADDGEGGDGGEVVKVVGILEVGYPIGVVVEFVVDHGTVVYVSEDFPVAFVHYCYYCCGIDEASVFVVDDSYSVVDSFAVAAADYSAPKPVSVVIGWTFFVNDGAFETDYQT